MSTDATAGGAPAAVAVTESPVAVGRSPEAQLYLPHPSVSRRHATVWRAGGVLRVEDHDSRFGTYVNGARVRAASARPGDRVRFGSSASYRVEPGGLRLDGASGMDLAAVGLTVAVAAPGGPGPVAALRRRLRGAPAGPGGAGARVLVGGVHLRVGPDRFVGLLGPSGAGKSTVLHCLAGRRVPDRGRLVFDGGRDAAAEAEAYRSMLGHVPQADVYDGRLTARENLLLAARLRRGGGPAAAADCAAAVEEALERVGLAGHGGTPAGALSGGQRKRLCVAVELLRRPRLLLLDEPTAGLDPAGEAHLMEQFRLVARRGTTVVCTTHLMDNLGLFDAVAVLGVRGGVGRLAYAGPPDGLLPHFGVGRFADLYEALAAGRFEPVGGGPEPAGDPAGPATCGGGDAAPVPAAAAVPGFAPARPGVGRPAAAPAADTAWGQFRVVVRRLATVAARDRGLVAALFAQPVALGLLVALTQYGVGRNELGRVGFFAAVVAVWLGLNNSARDLVRDRRHYARDRLAGLRPGAYLGARAAVHVAAGAAQLAALLAVLRAAGGRAFDPEVAAAFRAAPWPRYAAVLLLAYVGGLGLGLLVSALARTEEGAVAALPLVLMPQLLLSAVAAGVQAEPLTRPRPFRPLVTAAARLGDLPGPAALVDVLSWGCLSRPAALLLETPSASSAEALGDLCHLVILVCGVWAAVLAAFGRAERRWLGPAGLD